MPYLYEDLYRKTRLLVEAYVETRRQGQVLSVSDLAEDPSVVRAMQTLHNGILQLPPSEQVALYARMVCDAVRVSMAECNSEGEINRDKLQVTLKLIDGYCKNLLETAHRAIDAESEEPEG